MNSLAITQTFICLTAFFVVQTALQACSRTVYAFSRDKGLCNVFDSIFRPNMR